MRNNISLRKNRQRYNLKIKASNSQRFRLSVFRSSRHFYAQLIDDKNNATVASASSLKMLTEFSKTHAHRDVAEKVGQEIAQKARDKSISSVYLDRGPYKYHGKVKHFAESARKHGLEF